MSKLLITVTSVISKYWSIKIDNRQIMNVCPSRSQHATCEARSACEPTSSPLDSIEGLYSAQVQAAKSSEKSRRTLKYFVDSGRTVLCLGRPSLAWLGSHDSTQSGQQPLDLEGPSSHTLQCRHMLKPTAWVLYRSVELSCQPAASVSSQRVSGYLHEDMEEPVGPMIKNH